MTRAAGLLGYLAPDLPPERSVGAARRSPWRGDITATEAGPIGVIHALGGATVARRAHVAVALHGRLDNLAALRGDLGLAPDADPGAVVAEAYLRHGDEFGGRLVGDFALLVLDERRGTVLAVRDWVGTRPLFWGKHGEVVAWGSEVKQVLALLDLPYRPDERTLAAYEQMATPELTATFAEGVLAVPPGGQVLAGGRRNSPGMASGDPVRADRRLTRRGGRRRSHRVGGGR